MVERRGSGVFEEIQNEDGEFERIAPDGDAGSRFKQKFGPRIEALYGISNFVEKS